MDINTDEFKSLLESDSSEASDEHVVIHLESDGGSEHASVDKSSALKNLVDARNPSEDLDEGEVSAGYRTSSEMASLVSSTQAHASHGVLIDIVNSIMTPWKYWTGKDPKDASSTVSSQLEETSEEPQPAKIKHTGGLTGAEDGTDNTISVPGHVEASTHSATLYEEEGLLQQETEPVLPLMDSSRSQTQSSVLHPVPSKGKMNI